MKFSTRNDREKSFVNPERAASKIWRRLACAMLCVVLLGSNLTVAFATEGTTLTENEPVVTEQTAEVPETTEPKVPETTEPKAPETSEPETPETTEPKAPETSEPETPETTEPKAPETSEPETPETTEPKVPETTVPETTVPETTVPETTVPETTVPETTVPEEEAVTYTLYLTHVFRFKVDGNRRSVQASEEITLTEADFVDGVCDISRFAQKAEQIQDTIANPVSISIKEFGANHKGGAQILYTVKSGWKVVRKGESTGEGTALRAVFQGKPDDYEFVPVKVLTLNLKFAYSKTGGLAGIDAASPVTVQLEPKEIEEGKYKVTYPLPPVEGFRIVLDPTALNQYVVSPPTGKETAAELKEKLENGAFNVDIDKYTIYRYQEEPDQETHPTYQNRYSTEYNKAWNTARTLTAEEYTATAVGDNNNQGANPLKNAKLEVTLTEDQLKKALENQLNITVYYRRNATWYTVNHWVPKDLSGLTDFTGWEDKTEGGIEYVRRDQETLQGRVGATTRARAKVEGVYEELTPVGFTQKEIANTGTVVDIDYKAADSYRVIFDTDYTYIPRQQVALGNNVNFKNLTEPKRTGYTFGGWRYLKKDATPNADGSYNDDQYTELNKDNPELTVNNELIGKAKLTESGGVLALHLYPKWTTATTNVRVILWTEDLTGTDDVQAIAEGGNTTYYGTKYDAYKAAPVTHRPQPGTSNSNYSNAGSFTVSVPTDSYLLKNEKALLDSIQGQVENEFKKTMGKVSDIDVANFYTQAAFEIVHEEESGINYKATTASADGKTTIYVYFTRNVYELRFTYYGTANNSDYSVATNTNGYSWGGINDAASVFPGGDLNFGYRGTGDNDTKNNKWAYNLATSDVDMPVPKTITIKAKYGADLRNVWPVARGDEQIGGVRMISWATTRGKYCKDGQFGAATGSTHDGEPTIMGVYAAMGAEIVADPENTSEVHHLVAYWWKNTPSYYRYNHCYEVPGLNVNDTGVQRVSIHNNDPENVKNFLYLVPTGNAAIAQYGFNDLMRVSDKDGQITYNDPDGTYYAVRAYTTGDTTKYYAVARQVIAVSTNTIEKQNPSARLHMIRVNDKADHSTQYGNSAGGSAGNAIGTAADPYDLYFYYNRDRYTITYMAPSNNITTATEVTLGTVTLPYGALVTQKKYGYKLDYKSKNTDLAYGWTPAPDEVSVCPDRAKDGTAKWTFKGWGLGPGGVNMQWPMNEDAETEVQAGESFAIESNLRLYAIWGSPTYTVTFHLDGGMVNNSPNDIPVEVPANTRYSASGSIPRPLKNGHTLVGWYTKNADGQEIAFDFDQTIAENKQVYARWTPVSEVKFNYTIYYVTDTPHEADKTKPTVRIADDKIVTDDTGDTYYVLNKAEHENQMFIANSSLNFSAETQEGYVPRQTNKILTMVGDPKNNTYNVIFYYDPITPGQHTVRFVEAGTETGTKPNVVKEKPVKADQTVVTPQSAHATELKNMGYCLVVKNAEGGYTVVKEAKDMKWYDEKGTEKETETLIGNSIPATITYLVQPIRYTVTYTNADGSPSAAVAALTAVTADAGTSVENAKGKNPTQYTTKDEFTAKNPARVYENGKWYNFTHWSLGANTKVGNNSDFTDATLKVDRGTVGNLEFVANWAEVTNVGSLTVSKTVAGNAGDQTKDFNFRVTLSDTISGTFGDMTFTNGVATFTLKHDESKTATGLLSGLRYTVVETEANGDGYVTTQTNDTGTIPAPNNAGESQTVEAAFTNTKNVGSLTVTKTVVGGSAADQQTTFNFTVTLTDTSITGPYGGMNFTNGVATFQLRHNGTITATNLPTGVGYTVAETAAEGYTTTVAGNNENGTITAGETTVAFTNTKKEAPAPETGSLTVSKKVTGTGAETDRPFSFTVILGDTTISDTYGEMTFTDGKATFTLKDGESKTAEKLPVGVTYTVTEEETKDYTASSTGARGTVAKDQTLTAAFTNTKKETPAQETGSLTVSKKVTGTGAETDRPFSFTVTLSDTTISGVYGDMTFTDGKATFALKDGESKTAEKLPVGVTYTVTEEETKDYTASSTGAKGTIAKDQTLTAAFTNTKKEAPAPETGDLTVTKKVTGYKADKTKAFTFVVTLDDETINGQYGDMKFVDGRAEFTLKHGESKTAEDLPAGVAYTVKEGDNAGYAVTKTGDTGTIQARRNVYARFTNRKTNLDNYYQTGDETKLELWAGMAALCFLGAVVSLVISKKRKGKFSK